MTPLRHFLLALQFFTRIPVTGALARWVGFSPAMLQASAAYFPAVGYVVGAVAAGVLLAGLLAWPPMVAALLSTIATVLLTGAFHEDGLADVADGLGGAAERSRALEIMRDSRVGAFGALALVLALGLKIALLCALVDATGADSGMLMPVAGAGPSLPAPGAGLDAASLAWAAGAPGAALCSALIGAHVLSRLMPLALMRSLPYVGAEGGKAKPMAEAVGTRALLIAIACSAPALAAMVFTLGVGRAMAALLAAAAAGWFMRGWFQRRLQGFTGDGLGATQQVCELAIYLALAARWA